MLQISSDGIWVLLFYSITFKTVKLWELKLDTMQLYV